jgi:hypothetical protein
VGSWNDATLSGTAEISAKNFADTGADIAFALDGNAVTASDSLERCAYFTFDYSGVDSYYKNGLTTGDETNGEVIRSSPNAAKSPLPILWPFPFPSLFLLITKTGPQALSWRCVPAPTAPLGNPTQRQTMTTLQR